MKLLILSLLILSGCENRKNVHAHCSGYVYRQDVGWIPEEWKELPNIGKNNHVDKPQ